MSGFLRVLSSRRPGLVSKPTQHRVNYIFSKPPKDKVGVVESVGVMTVMCLAVFGPSGWILSHIHDYRKGG